MRIIRLSLIALVFFSACVQKETVLIPEGYVCNPFTDTHAADTGNVMQLRLGESYVNEITVSVTVCDHQATPNCVTIPHVLLDTGSNGLRLFSCTLSGLTMDPIASGSGELAECVHYLDGTSHWGAVKSVDVTLAGETATNVPIQVIDPRFGSIPSSAPVACNNSEYNPGYSQYNGILGVGLFAADCGSDCGSLHPSNNVYFSCPTGGTCSSVAVLDADQVTNPIALMPTDNNGVILTIPAVLDGGSASVTGTLTMGINTTAGNNSPGGGIVVYKADVSSGEPLFETDYGTLSGGGNSFIDSGSNGLYFDDTTIAGCPSSISGFFCPSPTLAKTATQKGSGVGGNSNANAHFRVGNASTILNSSNAVFSNLGGQLDGEFDWGLPFFMGRTIFVGIKGAATGSSLGSGPFWAYDPTVVPAH